MLKSLKNIFYIVLIINLFVIYPVSSKYVVNFNNNNNLLALNETSYTQSSTPKDSVSPSENNIGNNFLDIRNDLDEDDIILSPLNSDKKADKLDIPIQKNSNTTLDNNLGKIIDLKLDNQGGYTNLSFYVTKDFFTQVKVLNFPFRIVFDAPMPYVWSVPQNKLDRGNLTKIISSIRYGNPDDKTFRVITNLRFPVMINRAYFIPTNSSNNSYKLVINFREANIITNLSNSCTSVVPQDQAYYKILEDNNIKDECQLLNNKRKVAVNKWINSYLKNINYPKPVIQSSNKDSDHKVVVVIDPGHGGKDPGAQSALNSNIYEKDVVLSISNMIANTLLQNPNISVVLTRRGDYFVPLKDRVLWAKNFNADLFVSIHADMAPNQDSSGLSVYTLSQNASDAQTQIIAANENRSDLIAGLNNEEDTEVSRILINLLQRLKINDSVTLAQSILSSAAENVKLLPNPLRSAGFVVLQVPETPSVLIETGFLSNPKDAQDLAKTEYQKLVAQKISEGITNYLVSVGKIN